MPVVYVTAAYLIFQLLTRSDDLEILSHLPPTSSLRSPSSSASHLNLGGSNLHSDLGGQSHNPYAGLPYHLPQIPSPMVKTAPGDDSPSSFFRVVLGILVYPIYLLVTLIAVPLPLLLNALHIIASCLATILYPLTSTSRLIFRTFILTPLSLFRSVLAIFYPIYTFIGGVIGVGCVMGFGTAYIGKISLDLFLGRNRKSKSRSQRKSGSGRGSRISSKSSRSTRSSKKRDLKLDIRPMSDSDPAPEALLTPVPTARQREAFPAARTNPKRDEVRYAGLDVYDAYTGDARGSAREPTVIGTRRRTYGFDQR